MKKTSVYIGIAVHPERMSLIKLKQIKNEIIIESFEKVYLETGTVQDGKIKHPDLVSDAIKQLVTNSKTKQGLAALALPASQVINKRIKVAAYLNEEEIAAEISANFKIYLPGIDERLYFDFIPLETVEQEIELQLIAARAEQIEIYSNLCKKAGLKINRVDLDVFALARSVRLFSKDYFNQAVVILDIDTNAAQLILLKKGKVASVYPIVIEGEDILIQQINRGVQLFLSSEHFSVEKILLTGCLSNQEKLIKILKSEMTIPIETVDIFKHISIHPLLNSNKSNIDFAEYLVALGLALRGLAHA